MLHPEVASVGLPVLISLSPGLVAWLSNFVMGMSVTILAADSDGNYSIVEVDARSPQPQFSLNRGFMDHGGHFALLRTP